MLNKLFPIGQMNCVLKMLPLTVWGAQCVSLRGSKYLVNHKIDETNPTHESVPLI